MKWLATIICAMSFILSNVVQAGQSSVEPLTDKQVKNAIDASLAIQKKYGDGYVNDWEQNLKDPEFPRVIAPFGFKDVASYHYVVDRIKDAYLIYSYDTDKKRKTDIEQYIKDIQANTTLSDEKKQKLIFMQRKFAEERHETEQKSKADLPAVTAHIDAVRKAFDVPLRKCKGECKPHHGHH